MQAVGPTTARGDTLAGIPVALRGGAGRSPLQHRRRRGARNNAAGALAEDTAERAYRRRGAQVLARRRRIGGGELDLVVDDGGVLTFVEVKRRGTPIADSPVRPAQWRRLEAAAGAYLAEHADATGAMPLARFDVALVDGQGRVAIIEDAHRAAA
ncbi:MAG: YraN family protein [Pseudomonadota bacterium]